MVAKIQYITLSVKEQQINKDSKFPRSALRAVTHLVGICKYYHIELAECPSLEEPCEPPNVLFCSHHNIPSECCLDRNYHPILTYGEAECSETNGLTQGHIVESSGETNPRANFLMIWLSQVSDRFEVNNENYLENEDIYGTPIKYADSKDRVLVPTLLLTCYEIWTSYSTRLSLSIHLLEMK